MRACVCGEGGWGGGGGGRGVWQEAVGLTTKDSPS